MPKSPLAAKVAEKIKSEKLSVAAAAKAIGVNAPGLAALLRGKSSPNARTQGAYAKFLGISVEEVATLAGRESANGKKAAKGKHGAKAGKSATKAGPEPRAKRSAGTRGVSLAEAVALADDTLAVAVHRLDAKTREMIGRMLRY